jgi:hypothetical protein
VLQAEADRQIRVLVRLKRSLQDLGGVADSMDLDRGWIIRQLVRWYLGRPGAEAPERPRSVRK